MVLEISRRDIPPKVNQRVSMLTLLKGRTLKGSFYKKRPEIITFEDYERFDHQIFNLSVREAISVGCFVMCSIPPQCVIYQD